MASCGAANSRQVEVSTPCTPKVIPDSSAAMQGPHPLAIHLDAVTVEARGSHQLNHRTVYVPRHTFRRVTGVTYRVAAKGGGGG